MNPGIPLVAIFICLFRAKMYRLSADILIAHAQLEAMFGHGISQNNFG